MESELHAKYQKLGQEYQKLRAQVSVLKKGVIDEQANSKILQESLKQKDQVVRKYEQEIDSLQFRNDQLSKRVEILQTDLDGWERGSSKPKPPLDYKPNEIDQSVREQELEMKIKENEILHEQLHDVSQQHQIIVKDLQGRIDSYEREAAGHNKTIEDTNARYNRVIERLQEDRATMEGKVRKQEEELKIANIMIEKYQKQMKGSQSDLKTKLEKTSKLLKEKVPFQDTEKEELNILNVPVCDRSHQLQTRRLVGQFATHFVEFMGSLSDYHTYLEQRINIFSADLKQEQLSAVNSKFSVHLRENAQINRQTQQAMSDFNESIKQEHFISLKTCKGLTCFSRKFTEFSCYLDKLMQYHILSHKEECSWPSCSEEMEKESKEFIKNAKQFTATISRLQRSLLVLSSVGESNIPISNCPRLFQMIAKQIETLFEVSQGMCKSYNAKMVAEEQLPMLTERLRNTNQCMMSSLAGIAAASSKFLKFFSDNIAFISSNAGFKRKGVVSDEEQGMSSSVKTFHSKATRYLQNLRKDAPVTIPYEIAVKNNRTLMTSTESRDTLAEEVANSRQTIAKLEQEKQHWLLEAQLLKAKFEKEVKKVASLGDELGRLKTEAIHSRQSSESIEDMLQKEISMNNVASTPSLMRQASSSSSSTTAEQTILPQPIGTLEVWSKERDSGDAERDQEHEELVKTHLTSRINDLTKQLQLADSKSVNHYAECRALYKQLVLADKGKKKIANDLVQAKAKLSKLEDELETTKRSYEDQIKMLSDHLCGMNDKLTSQKDQIDLLKTATPSKSSGKLGFGRKKQP